MKKLVLGPPLAGKTTLVRYLRINHPGVPVKDYDEEIIAKHDGDWSSIGGRHGKATRESILRSVLESSSVIFFSFELSTEVVREAKDKGFTIFTLVTDHVELARRNAIRLREEPEHPDPFAHVERNLQQMHLLARAGLVNMELDARQPTEELVRIILSPQND